MDLEQQRVRAFPDWPLHMHLMAWRKRHKGQRIAAGTPFLAPDGQCFTVTGRLFWRYAGSKRPSISLVWQSHCQVCAVSYTFNKPYHTRNLVRTCPAHRGQAAKRIVPPTKLQALILTTLNDPAWQLIGKLDYETLFAHCAVQLPRGAGRDTRRQRIVRAAQQLIDKGAWPSAWRLSDHAISYCTG